MAVLVLVGGQRGEEGTEIIADALSSRAKVVVRYALGNPRPLVHNAQGEFGLSIIPRSIFQPRTISLLGASTVIPPWLLVEEMDALEAGGVDMRRFFISTQAHIIMPYHVRLDELEQQTYGTPAIDSPGIDSALADKISRIGIQAGDLVNEELFLTKLTRALAVKNAIFTKVYGQEPFALHQMYHDYLAFGKRLKPHLVDQRLIVQRALAGDHNIVREGDQGALLDLDYGAYPYVSGVATNIGQACVTNGIPPTNIGTVLGVFRAYTVQAQTGPLPTEMETGEAAALAKIHAKRPAPVLTPAPTLPPLAPITLPAGMQPGDQHGYVAPSPKQQATATSPRFGWFDCVAARFVARLNALSALAITHLSDLDSCPTLKICTQYSLDDTRLSEMPVDLDTLSAVRPIYEELPGWQTSTSGIRRFADLPPNAQTYLRRIQRGLGLPLALACTGSHPDAIISLFDPFVPFNFEGVALNGKVAL